MKLFTRVKLVVVLAVFAVMMVGSAWADPVYSMRIDARLNSDGTILTLTYGTFRDDRPFPQYSGFNNQQLELFSERLDYQTTFHPVGEPGAARTERTESHSVNPNRTNMQAVFVMDPPLETGMYFFPQGDAQYGGTGSVFVAGDSFEQLFADLLDVEGSVGFEELIAGFGPFAEDAARNEFVFIARETVAASGITVALPVGYTTDADGTITLPSETSGTVLSRGMEILIPGGSEIASDGIIRLSTYGTVTTANDTMIDVPGGTVIETVASETNLVAQPLYATESVIATADAAEIITVGAAEARVFHPAGTTETVPANSVINVNADGTIVISAANGGSNGGNGNGGSSGGCNAGFGFGALLLAGIGFATRKSPKA